MTNTNGRMSATHLTEENFMLLWAMLQQKNGGKGMNWGNVAKYLKPEEPDKSNTVSMRYSRLKERLDKDLGTMESKGIEVAQTPKKVSAAATKPKTPKKRSTEEAGGSENVTESPTKKVKEDTEMTSA